MQALAPRQFIAEFVKELILALLAAMLLARTRQRLLLELVRLPAGVYRRDMTTEIVGFVCAGLVVAALVKPATAS